MSPPKLCFTRPHYLRSGWCWLILVSLTAVMTAALSLSVSADYSAFEPAEAVPAPVTTRGIGVEARIQEIEQTWETDYTAFLRSPSGLPPLDGADSCGNPGAAQYPDGASAGT
jgi:hypothetical protein